MYILPDKFKWKLTKAEAWAGIYAVISMAIFSLLATNHDAVWRVLSFEIINFLAQFTLAVLSFYAAYTLANSQETLLAIRLFQNEAKASNKIDQANSRNVKVLKESEDDDFEEVFRKIEANEEAKSETIPASPVSQSAKNRISGSSIISMNHEYANTVAQRN